MQILLVRHAAHSDLGHALSGRAGDIALDETGREQAHRLAAHLADRELGEVQSSPVRRARETAEAIARSRGLTVRVVDPLDEVDFGEWEGETFAALDQDPRWHHWNEHRGEARAPGGETMAQVQERVSRHIAAEAGRSAQDGAARVIAMVSHCDVIRAAVAAVIGLPLGRLLSFDVDPASITRIAAGEWGSRLLGLNERAA